MLAKPGTRRSIFFILLVLATSSVAYLAVAYSLASALSGPDVKAGQVAAQDVLAPRTASYESEILTEQQREQAARLVSPIYTSTDLSIARQQVDLLRDVLAYISSVRADAFASTEQKLSDLTALQDIKLRQDTALKILPLTDARWQVIQQEAISVLEQTMRTTIREDRVEEARRGVPARISLSLPEEQAAIVAELVTAFVTPNSLFSQELTDEARQDARDAVEPVSRSFVTGETIIQRGRVVTDLDIETLQELGLLEKGDPLQEQLGVAGVVLLALLAGGVIIARRTTLLLQPRSLTLVTLLFLIFLVSARLTIPGHTVLPYLFPLAAFSLTLSTLFGVELALMLILPLGILTTYGLPNALDLFFFFLMSAIFGVFALGRAQRISAFLRAGLASTLAGALTVIAYRLTGSLETDLLGMTTLIGAAAFNGMISAVLAVILQYLLAEFVGLTTPLQLMDLSRPDHPLLQFILRRAPGTYQHSLQVANLAEQAAEQINADALLTRVGALYHDSGKAINPAFYIENQIAGAANPHDDLEPTTSAAIIIRHVTDGLELAQKYRLPQRIRDFIGEHHGDSITRYQYGKALEAAHNGEEALDPENFRYPGPRPRSRETAILMLADSSEATTRAKNPPNEEELRKVIRQVVTSRLEEGQLDDTNLTLRDLNTIIDSFTATLKGVFHPRIEYPKLKSPLPELTAISHDSPTVPVEALQRKPAPVETRPEESP